MSLPPPGAGDGATSRTTDRTLLYLALGVFLVHAANYLYFFVDDEGIPFVFARNLLRGRGLVYNSFEGRVEGYSDLLHVLVSAGWLRLTEALHFGPLSPFFFGKAMSFASGAATVVVAWAAMRHLRPTPAGLAAGLVFLVTFVPLATWSCSSLEMAMVGLLVATAMLGLLHESPAWDAVTMGACVALVLERIDGFVWAGALLGPALLMARHRRRALWREVAMPVLAALVLYHAWRVLYFGEWLPSPLAAKILYKVVNTTDVVRHDPAVPYLWRFLHQYGLPAALAAAVFVVAGAVRDRRARPLLLTAAALVTYCGLVGDWMVGFRFLVPVAPVFSVLVAVAVSRIRRPAIAWTVAAAATMWLGTVALRSAGAVDTLEYRESWWAHPSLDHRFYFSRYLRLSEDLAGVVPRGSRTAYNQAGIVPYLLDLDNLDDLGICSRFVSHLPTTDVVFTEVGRLSPLKATHALTAAQSYILYRDPQFVIEPLKNLVAANAGKIPDAVLRGRYALLSANPHAGSAVYERTSRSTDEFRTNPRTFLENLATPSRLMRAFDGSVVPPGQRLSRLPFLAEGTLDRTVTGRVSYDVEFAAADEPVYELDIDSVWARTDVQLTLVLRDTRGGIAALDGRTLAGGRQAGVALSWPHGVRASALELTLTTESGPTRVILHDLRVQGQSRALAAYVERLPFPPR